MSGSIFKDNIEYNKLKVQRDAHGFVCILYFTIFSLHVSDAISAHHQEHKLKSTAVGMRRHVVLYHIAVIVLYQDVRNHEH
jgi:hypothetical protein